MSDRTCPKCNHTYKYPSMLKSHLRKSFHCLTSEEDIYLHFNPIININKCNKCLQSFSQKSSLYRHQRNINCNIQSKIDNIQNNIPIQNIIPNQVHNTTNNNNNNNNNTTINNTTINNNNNNTIIIQHVNPFGYEDVRVIPIEDMKAILNSGYNSGFQIIKAIYSKFENKNFYKPNMSKSDIAVLNSEFNLSIKKNKEFCDALFDRCIVLLHHMLYLCKNEFSKSTIKNIYDNIEYIENTMRTEIYDKKLQTIIESEFRNNNIDNKDRIQKFIKGAKDNSDVKETANELVTKTKLLSNESENEYKTSISDKELNDVLGDPKVLIGLIKKELAEDFLLHRFENTRFYKFWRDRMKNEKLYVKRCKTATIGDMKTLKQRTKAIELMLNVIKVRADNLIPGALIDLDVEGFTFEYIARHVNDIVDDSEDEDEERNDVRSIHTVDDNLDYFLD